MLQKICPALPLREEAPVEAHDLVQASRLTLARSYELLHRTERMVRPGSITPKHTSDQVREPARQAA